MVNIKGIAKRYGLEVNDLDSIYYSVYKQVKKLGTLQEDFFNKYLMDKLQELEINDKDMYSIADYYTDVFIDEENNKLADKILDSDKEPIEVVQDELKKDHMDDVIQTSGEISQVIGKSRPKGYETKLVNLYTEQKDKEE